eukprot:2514639-Rhodomonas_salina.1
MLENPSLNLSSNGALLCEQDLFYLLDDVGKKFSNAIPSSVCAAEGYWEELSPEFAKCKALRMVIEGGDILQYECMGAVIRKVAARCGLNGDDIFWGVQLPKGAFFFKRKEVDDENMGGLLAVMPMRPLDSKRMVYYFKSSNLANCPNPRRFCFLESLLHKEELQRFRSFFFDTA